MSIAFHHINKPPAWFSPEAMRSIGIDEIISSLEWDIARLEEEGRIAEANLMEINWQAAHNQWFQENEKAVIRSENYKALAQEIWYERPTFYRVMFYRSVDFLAPCREAIAGLGVLVLLFVHRKMSEFILEVRLGS